MHKYKALLLVILLSLTSLTFSNGFTDFFNFYSPPLGGEQIFRLQSPNMISGGASTTGGPLMHITPGSAVVNPAVTGGIQQITLHLSGLFLANVKTGSEFGGGANLGALFPSRWGVATFNLQSTFADSFNEMSLGNVVSLYSGFSKDFSDTIYVGAGLTTTLGYTAKGFNWGLELSLGFWNNLGTIGFIKDARWGLSITGMGKPYSGTLTLLQAFPAMFTLRGGLAGTLVSKKNFVLGTSLDLSVPMMVQNLILDMGLEAYLFNKVSIRTGWNVNLRECMAGNFAIIPSVAVVVRLKTKISLDVLSKNEIQQTEIIPALAVAPLYNGVTAFSGGITAHLGMRDAEAPVINIWEE